MSNNSLDVVEYIIGDGVPQIQILEPFNELVCDFLENLSKEILFSAEARKFSDLVSFGYWCRKAHIDKLKSDFNDGKVRLGRGLALHIAPSNVPLNFAFSFVFGLLSGNSNIVKIPSKYFEQATLLCRLIKNLLSQSKYKSLHESNTFVKYMGENSVTAKLSVSVGVRLIWGGGEAIRMIRQTTIPDRCVELVFADRYSCSLINIDSISGLDDAELERLVNSYYNDTFLMDQNACSSPHLVLWFGSEDLTVSDKFWQKLAHVAASRNYTYSLVGTVDKLTTLCSQVIEFDNFGSFNKFSEHIYVVTLRSLSMGIDSIHSYSGYFTQVHISSLDDLTRVITPRYQTLTYWGFSRGELINFVSKNRLVGIDRVVPIGSALEIDVDWDGYEILRNMSRVITIN